MPSETLSWPIKTRDLHNHHFDSTMWDGFAFRNDDIIIATYAKSGTTWLQQIVSQLIFAGEPDLPVAQMSPWLDLRVPPREVKLPAVDAQTHRRFIKTHLPVDALVYSPQAKYLYVARDGRDVVWSLYNHHANANALWYEMLNDTPGLVGPPIGKPPADIRQYFHEWFDGDGYPFWPFWENIRSWWNVRHLPNLLLLHFNDLKADMPGQIRRIADFLSIAVNDKTWPQILEHCSFDYMKNHAEKSVPLDGALWEGGAKTFVYKGTSARWRGTLTDEDNSRYKAKAISELGEDCARWLAQGGQ